MKTKEIPSLFVRSLAWQRSWWLSAVIIMVQHAYAIAASTLSIDHTSDVQLTRHIGWDNSLLIRATGPGSVAFSDASINAKEVIFASFRIRPSLGEVWAESTFVSFRGASFGFELKPQQNGSSSRSASLVALSLRDKQRRPQRVALSIGTKDAIPTTCVGLNLTIRIDRRTATWDLFVGNRMLIANEALDDETRLDRLTIFPGVNGSLEVSGVAIGNRNPLFADVNVNAIPDDFEARHDPTALHEKVRSTRLLQAYRASTQ